MKKLFLFIIFFALTSCHHGFHCFAAEESSPVKRIVASTFPIYLFTANICANIPDVSVELLVPSALGCPHDFAMRPQDMQKLAKADILVINGGGMEDFLARPLQMLDKPLPVVDAGKNIALLPADHGDHAHDNPHIFASPSLALSMIDNIAAGLAQLDNQNAKLYAENADRYIRQIDPLNKALRAIGENAENRNIAIEHDALAYIANNAGLNIIATFENNLSPAVLAKLQKQLKQEAPRLLAGDSQYPDKLLELLSGETGIPFAKLNPCANGPEDAPANYYQLVMGENIRTLEKYFD